MGKTAPPFLLTDSVLGIEATVFYYFLIVVQSLSCVWCFATPWTVVRRASLSFTISRNLFQLIGKDPDVGKDQKQKKKRITEDEMVR